MRQQTISCDIPGCNESGVDTDGQGFHGWGALHGISLNGTPNPCLCPLHLAAVAEFIDSLGGKQ